MDNGGWLTLMWAIIGMGSAAVAWIAKEIIKPWSAAYLKKIEDEGKLKEAQSQHFEAIDKALVLMVTDSKSQTTELKKQSELLTDQSAWWRAWDSDKFKTVCQAHALNDALLVTAKSVTDTILDLAKTQSESIKETARIERENVAAAATAAAAKAYAQENRATEARHDARNVEQLKMLEVELAKLAEDKAAKAAEMKGKTV